MRLLTSVAVACLSASAGGTVVHLDDAAAAHARSFDGVGALSGGGGTSILLSSYPDHVASDILDVLFKPGVAASLQMLKLEIGGDGQSTEAAESSHEHVQGEVACTRGYEFALAKEAKARNPAIKLYGLPWSFPSWLAPHPTDKEDGTDPLGQDPNATAAYVANWVKCAKSAHGLHIDYVGVWNEMDDSFGFFGIRYVKTLRDVLDAHGLHGTKVVAGDLHSWQPAAAFAWDAGVRESVAVLGKHYPGTLSEPDAVAAGVPLWSSEDAAVDSTSEAGGRCQARVINQNFVRGNMSATIMWNLVSSYYDFLPLPNCGLLRASSPWSGHYDVDPPVFAVAHTTLFVKPGDAILPVGKGSALLKQGGSMVSYVRRSSGNGGNRTRTLSIVIEKVPSATSACSFSDAPQYATSKETVQVKLQGPLRASLAGTTLSAFRSNFATATFMQEIAGGVPVGDDGSFSVVVDVDDVISITSAAGAAGPKLPDVPPAAKGAFPLLYREDFESYADQAFAKLITPQSGAFDVRAGAADDGGHDDGHGNVLRQAAVGPPIVWSEHANFVPFAVLGDSAWADVSVAVEAKLDGGGAPFVGARVTFDAMQATTAKGVFFGVNASTWFVATDLTNLNGSVLKSGPTTVLGSAWHNLSLSLTGSSATGRVDGSALFSGLDVSGAPSPHGAVVFGLDSFRGASFDNLVVEAAAPGGGGGRRAVQPSSL
jgi:galactosylceramidase